MKAILVIDLPDNLNKAIEDIRVDIKANLYGNEILDWRNQRIKPMPEKMGEYKDQCLNNYALGWNACIDELVGDE